MKKFLIISLVLFCLVTGLSFAGGQSESGSGSDKYVIATVVKVDGIAWFERMREGVKQFGEETGNETFMIGPAQSDAAEQVKIVEDLIAQGVDAICIVPFSVEAVEPVLKKARDQGIVVISHEASNQVNADYIIEAFVNEEYGANMMDNLAKAMGEKGEYVVTVGSLTSKSHNEWMDGAIAHQKKNYPQMKMVGTKIEENDDATLAYQKIKEAIVAYPNLAGVIGAPMTTSAGAGLAVDESGLQDKIAVVSTGLVSVAGQYLESGAVDSIHFWDPKLAGLAMNKLALMVLEGDSDQIKQGLDLGYAGYHNIAVPDSSRPNLLFGAGWVDVTTENMGEYNF